MTYWFSDRTGLRLWLLPVIINCGKVTFICLIDRKYLIIGNDQKFLDVSVSRLETLFIGNKRQNSSHFTTISFHKLESRTWCFFVCILLALVPVKSKTTFTVFWDVMLCSLVAKY